MFQPQRFDVLPVEVGRDDHANAPVPAQVTRGRVVGEGRVEDPVRDQVVRGPVGEDIPDAEEVQPEEVTTKQTADPGPIIRRSARVSRVPSKYKDYVMED